MKNLFRQSYLWFAVLLVSAVLSACSSTGPSTKSPVPQTPASVEMNDAATSEPSASQGSEKATGGTAEEAAGDTTCAPVPKDFLEALARARRPKKENISRELWTILRDNEALKWNKEGQVLMTTWSNPDYFPYKQGEIFPLYSDTFLTAVPEVQDWCTKYAQQQPEDLNHRLHQLLGLQPPQSKKVKKTREFIQIWVSPQHIFRPCADPEITDHECQISVPFLGADSPPTPTSEPPWLCPNPFLPPQVTGAFSQVNTASLSWICSWWETAYGNTCPSDNYPWTALGYTFDWGNLEDPKGPSEFVALGQSMVTFEAKIPTREYCGLP